MSTISDWHADYKTADTNFPQDAEPVPFPVDGHGDLGFVLRDIKAVARQQSLDRLFEPDSRAATFSTGNAFFISGDLRTVYPTGTAVQIVLAGGTVYSWVRFLNFAAGATTFGLVHTAILTNPITSVRFSALKGGSTAGRAANGYGPNIGAPFAYRIGQRGQFQITDPNTVAAVTFLHQEIDTSYRILIQPISQTGGSANGSYRYTDITKTTSGFTLTVGQPPGGGIMNIYEYQIMRGT